MLLPLFPPVSASPVLTSRAPLLPDELLTALVLVEGDAEVTPGPVEKPAAGPPLHAAATSKPSSDRPRAPRRARRGRQGRRDSDRLGPDDARSAHVIRPSAPSRACQADGPRALPAASAHAGRQSERTMWGGPPIWSLPAASRQRAQVSLVGGGSLFLVTERAVSTR